MTSGTHYVCGTALDPDLLTDPNNKYNYSLAAA